MEPIEYLRALKRHWPLIVLCVAIAVAFTWTNTPADPPPPTTTYRAANTMVVAGSAADPNARGLEAITTINFAVLPLITTTGTVPERVAARLGASEPPAALAAQVSVEIDEKLGVVRIVSLQQEADKAVALADAFARELALYLDERAVQAQQARLDSLSQRLAQLEQQTREYDLALFASGGFDELTRSKRDAVVRSYGATFELYQQTATATPTGGLIELEAAQPVPLVSGGFQAPRDRRGRLPIAAGVGLLLGAGAALVLDRFDLKVRTRRKAEEAIGEVVVAELPTIPRKAGRRQQLMVSPTLHGAVPEAYRSLRATLDVLVLNARSGALDAAAMLKAAGANGTNGNGHHAPVHPKAPVIVFGSSQPGEGKTTTSANVAAAFAETGKRVLAVNTDFRRPRLGRFLVPGYLPPTDLSLDDVAEHPAHAVLDTNVAGVQLLDLSGIDAPPGDLARATLRALEQVRAYVDVVIVDSPPLLVTAEAVDVTRASDVTVLIGRLKRSKVDAMRRAAELARQGGARTLVGLLTDCGRPFKARYRGYYAYSYGSAAGRRKSPAGQTAGGLPSPRQADRVEAPVAVADESPTG